MISFCLNRLLRRSAAVPIGLLALGLLLLSTGHDASAAERVVGVNLRSASSFSALSAMPPELRRVFLALNVPAVKGRLPFLVRQRNIPLLMRWNKDTGRDWVKMGGKEVTPTLRDVSMMTVAYYPMGAPPFINEPRHELTIEYEFGQAPYHTGRAVRIQILYFPPGVGDARLAAFKDYWCQPQQTLYGQLEGRELIGGLTAVVGYKELRTPAAIAAGTNEVTNWTATRTLHCVHLAHGRFLVEISSEIPDSFDLGSFHDNPHWVSHTWPGILRDISIQVSRARDITPFVELVAAAIKGTNAEAASIAAAPELSAMVTQMIDGPDRLIHGKPAMLGVRLAWADQARPSIKARVTWRRNGAIARQGERTFKRQYSRREVLDGKDALLFFFTPDHYAHATDRHEIEVEVPSTVRGQPPVKLTREISLPVRLMAEATLRVRFVPVGIGPWGAGKLVENGTRLREQHFNSIRTAQMAYLRDLYPLPPGEVKDITRTNLLFEITPTATERVLTGVTKVGLLNRLEAFYTECRDDGIHFVVGITPSGWLGDMGITEPSFPHAILIDEAAPATVLAHELGHHLGFAHNQDVYGREMLSDEGWRILKQSPPTLVRMGPPRPSTDKIVDWMDVDPLGPENTWMSRENLAKLVEAIQGRLGSSLRAVKK